MRIQKIACLSLILILIFVPKGHIIAQEASSTSGTGFDLEGMAEPLTGPFDNFFNQWLKGGLDKAQTGLKDAASKASDKTQQAAKDAISKQVQKETQKAKTGFLGSLERVKIQVQEKIGEINLKIKLFFKKLNFKSKPDTY